MRNRATAGKTIRCAAVLACWLICASRLSAEAIPEYEVKAAFLFNFSKYVEWPERAFSGTADRILICVLGENPFGPFLAELVKEKKVNGRELAVEERSVSATAGCHIVFIAASERRLGEIVGRLANRPVLTVSDGASVADQGAVIGLTMNDNRVRFEVNLIAARRAGLKLSSQLLKVAIRLIGETERGAR